MQKQCRKTKISKLCHTGLKILVYIFFSSYLDLPFGKENTCSKDRGLRMLGAAQTKARVLESFVPKK